MSSTSVNLYEEYVSRVAASKPRNFSIIIVVHGLWCLGTAFFSHFTLLPVFLDKLGASNLVIGFLPATMMLCMFLPQVLAAQLTAALPVKKHVFACVHYPGTLPVLVLGFLTWSRVIPSNQALIVFTLVAAAAFGLALSFAMPMWSNLAAKLLPAESRGRHFGTIFFVGGLTGIGGGIAARTLIANLPFPSGFAVGFVIAGFLMTGAVSLFFFLDEPAHPQPYPVRGLVQTWRIMCADLRDSPDYAWYLFAQVMSSLAKMAVPFYGVALINRNELPLEAAAEFTIIFFLARALASPIVGFMGDRVGFRFLAILSPLLMLFTTGTLFIGDSHFLAYLLFVLMGFAYAAETLAMYNLPIEYCPHADKTTFLAAHGTIVGPALAIAPIFGGALADSLRGAYTLTFLLAMALESVAIVILVACVKDPKAVIDDSE